MLCLFHQTSFHALQSHQVEFPKKKKNVDIINRVQIK